MQGEESENIPTYTQRCAAAPQLTLINEGQYYKLSSDEVPMTRKIKGT